MLIIVICLQSFVYNTHTDTLYKCVSESVFKARIHDGKFIGNPDEEKDGFLHFSEVQDAIHDCEAYHGDVQDLWLLRISILKLTDPSKLKWEQYDHTGPYYPHLYDFLNIPAIDKIYPIPINQTTHKHIYPPLPSAL